MNDFETENFNRGDQEEFKIHYYLRDGSHEMDAVVRNRCETEVLGLLGEVSKVLGVQFKVDLVPPAPGGWEEHLLIIGQYREQITFIRDIVCSIFTMAGAGLFFRHKLRQSEQQTILNDLAIAKAKCEIDKMKREAAHAADGKTAELGLEAPMTPEAIASALLGKQKIKRKRSNLYRTLSAYSKVEAVGFSNQHRRGAAENIVRRHEFDAYISEPEDMEPVIYERVKMEVVSPILRGGDHPWRGAFQGKTISFELEDAGFRRQVRDQEVSFQNGTTLLCDLEIQLREDETGEPVVTKRVVRKVHGVEQPRKVAWAQQRLLDLPDSGPGQLAD